MIPTTTFYKIIKEMRSIIIELSGIDQTRVFNAASVRGPDLLKVLDDTNLMSFDLKDTFIVFEVLTGSEENYYTYDNDDNLISFNNLRMNLKIYGNFSYDLARGLLLRLNNITIFERLKSLGIIINDISFPTIINEFINNTVWPRSDMQISIMCSATVEDEKSQYFEAADKIIISTISKEKK